MQGGQSPDCEDCHETGPLPREPGSLEIVVGATDVVGGGLGIFNLFVGQRNSWEERRKEGTTPKSQRPREGSLWDTVGKRQVQQAGGDRCPVQNGKGALPGITARASVTAGTA